MQVFELSTKNGRVFRVAVSNENQQKRLNKVIRENKEKGYEVFTEIKCITSGIHSMKEFEALSEKLV